MTDAAQHQDDVLSMAEYLRDTIREIDDYVAAMQSRRAAFAMRLAALEAADNEAVLAAGADHERRAADDQPYEDARDIEDVLGEAHRRFG